MVDGRLAGMKTPVSPVYAARTAAHTNAYPVPAPAACLSTGASGRARHSGPVARHEHDACASVARSILRDDTFDAAR